MRSARPWCVRDEDHRLATLTSALDFGNPILEAASELERGLSRDVSAVVLSERECFQRGSGVEPRGHDGPINDQRLRDRRALTACERVLVAREDLFVRLAPVNLHLVRLRDQDGQTSGRRQVVEERRRSIRFVGPAGNFGQRNDGGLVD